MWLATAGFVPGWLLVTESDDELRAVDRWTGSPGFGIQEMTNQHLVLVLQLDFGSGETAHATYRYRLRDVQHMNWLRTMLAIKWVRLDVYQLDAANQLRFRFSFGTPLPRELVDKVREHVRNAIPDDSELTLFETPTVIDQLHTMGGLERTYFENLAIYTSELDEDSDLGEAYRHYLAVTATATFASFRGSPIDDHQYAEAKEYLQVELSRRRDTEHAPLQIEHLGRGRALIQFVVTVDAPVALLAFVAYTGSSGQPVVQDFEFSHEVDLGLSHSTLDELSAYLSNGLAGLTFLLDADIESLVISVGAGVYNLPFHDALLQLGFREVSYTHRVGLLARTDANVVSPGALISGFAGQGSDRIASVEAELKVVAALTGGAIDSPSRSLPRIVHFAGHARTGSQPYEVGISLGPSQIAPLSAARVLLDIDASATQLVFLSACGTGAGDFMLGELPTAIPLDVAFLEKGAQAVVSTAAPVNDHVAAFFACVFHHELAGGSSIWESYAAARQAASDADLGSDRHDLEVLLSSHWPGWRADIAGRKAAGDESWRLFRVSGRHW